MVWLGAVLAVLLLVAFVWTITDAIRHPDRYRGMFDGRRFRVALPWVVCLTVAAIAGAELAGGGGVIWVILGIALLVLAGAVRADALARWNKPRR